MIPWRQPSVYLVLSLTEPYWELEYSTFDVLLEQGLPYSAATEENGFPYGDYLLVSGFLDQAKPELELAGEYLGLSIKTKGEK